MTHVTSLPNEIWFQIFNCLEAHDVINAFSSLNRYFDELLHSDYLRVHLRVTKNERHPILPRKFTENLPLESIRSISAGLHATNCLFQFLRWHSIGLFYLKSLKIYLRKYTLNKSIHHLIIALDNLPSLKVLRIQSHATNLDWVQLADLLHIIFSDRLSLTHCELILPSQNFNLGRIEFAGFSTIRHLTIEDISWVNLLLILSATPNLVFLNTSLHTSFSAPTSLVLPSLRKLVVRIAGTPFIVLEEIRGIAPHLESFSVGGSFSVNDETFFREKSWKNLLKDIRSYQVGLNDWEFNSANFEALKNRFAPFVKEGWMIVTQSDRSLNFKISFQSK